MMKRPEDDEGEKEEQDGMAMPQDLAGAGDVPNIAHNSDFGMPVNFEGVEVHPTIPPLPPLPGEVFPLFPFFRFERVLRARNQYTLLSVQRSLRSFR